MSPLSWAEAGLEDAEFDRQALTGQLPDEFYGRINFAEAFGICIERPTDFERRAHRAHRLANRGNRPVAAGRRPTTHAHGGAHE